MKPDSGSETVVLSSVIVCGVIGLAFVVYSLMPAAFAAAAHAFIAVPH